MTDFDPNATPECDANLRFVNSAGKTYVCLPLEIGVELERRARVAEEKLRIAMEVLTTSCVYDYTDVQTALKEIYEVDP